MCVYTCVYIYIYIYRYIDIEREICLFIYLYAHTYTCMCVYMYVCIWFRERHALNESCHVCGNHDSDRLISYWPDYFILL